MLNKKVTKEDLLALCLGCVNCKGIWVDEDGTIIVPMDGKIYWLKSTGWEQESLHFCDDGYYVKTKKTKINNTEELKEAMRHHWYKYNV